MPLTLADTGLCVDAALHADRRRRARVPAAVRAVRRRRDEAALDLRCRAGTTIDTSDMDHWKFPVGTKLWKEFTRDGTRVETRLITKLLADDTAPGAWFYASYVWNRRRTRRRSRRPRRRDERERHRARHPDARRTAGAATRTCAGRVLGFNAMSLDFDAASGELDLADAGRAWTCCRSRRPRRAPAPYFPLPGHRGRSTRRSATCTRTAATATTRPRAIARHRRRSSCGSTVGKLGDACDVDARARDHRERQRLDGAVGAVAARSSTPGDPDNSVIIHPHDVVGVPTEDAGDRDRDHRPRRPDARARVDQPATLSACTASSSSTSRAGMSSAARGRSRQAALGVRARGARRHARSARDRRARRSASARRPSSRRTCSPTTRRTRPRACSAIETDTLDRTGHGDRRARGRPSRARRCCAAIARRGAASTIRCRRCTRRSSRAACGSTTARARARRSSARRAGSGSIGSSCSTFDAAAGSGSRSRAARARTCAAWSRTSAPTSAAGAHLDRAAPDPQRPVHARPGDALDRVGVVDVRPHLIPMSRGHRAAVAVASPRARWPRSGAGVQLPVELGRRRESRAIPDR